MACERKYHQYRSISNWRVREWFPDLDEKTYANLTTYFNELQKFNKIINLISPKIVIHADAIHFADSILATTIISKKINTSVYHMTSDEWALEVSQIPTQLCSLWQPSLEQEYKLPIGDIKMFVVNTTKIS